MVAGQLGSEQSSRSKCSDSETLSGVIFLSFFRPTSYPYQKRQEQNEIEHISKFHLHKNARLHQASIKAKKMPGCNHLISHGLYCLETPFRVHF